MALIVAANAYSSVLSEYARALEKSKENSTYLFDFRKLKNSAGTTMAKVEVSAQESASGWGGTYHLRCPNWGKLAGVVLKYTTVAGGLTKPQDGSFWSAAGNWSQKIALNWATSVSLDTLRGTTIETHYRDSLHFSTNAGSVAYKDKQSQLTSGYFTAGATDTGNPIVAKGDQAPVNGVWYVEVPFSCCQNPMTQPDLASTEQMQITVQMSPSGGALNGMALQTGGYVIVTAIFYLAVTSQSDRLMRQSMEFRGGISTIPLVNRFLEGPVVMTGPAKLAAVNAYAEGFIPQVGLWQTGDFPLRCKNSVKYTIITVWIGTQSKLGYGFNGDIDQCVAPTSVTLSSAGTVLFRTTNAERLLTLETGDSMGTTAKHIVIPWALVRDLADKDQTVSCEGGSHLASLAAPTLNVQYYNATQGLDNAQFGRNGSVWAATCLVHHVYYQATQYVTNSTGLGFSWAVTDTD